MRARGLLRTVLSVALPAALVSGVALAAPAGAAGSAEEFAAVRARGPAHLVDGGLDVRVRARCAAGLTAFELGATVRQGARTAGETLVERDVVPCDGRAHTRVLRILTPDGAFSPRRARVEAHLATFSPDSGDALVTRTSRIRILPERNCVPR